MVPIGFRPALCFEATRRVWSVPSAARTGARLHRGCAVADPEPAGRAVKTNRRDAVSLARLVRANELTPGVGPDETHEAVRDLARTRCPAVADYRRKRRQAVIVPVAPRPPLPWQADLARALSFVGWTARTLRTRLNA